MNVLRVIMKKPVDASRLREIHHSGEMAFMSGGTLLMDIMSVMNQEHHGVIDLLSCRQTALIGCLRPALNSVTILSRSGTASQAAPVLMRFV